MTNQPRNSLGLAALLGRRKLIVSFALLVSLLGALFWLTMPRQEDPPMPDYWGQIVVHWAGADALTVERQLLEPIERHLARVEDLDDIEATAFPELAHLSLQLREGVDDPAATWDEVRRALARAEADLPAEAGRPRLDDDLQSQESIVLALSGEPDPLRLQATAEELEDLLLDLPLVSDVRRLADPGEQITIAIDDTSLAQLGLSAHQVAAQLQGRTRTLPGGNLRVGDHSITLRPESELNDLAEIRRTPLVLDDGSRIPLGAVATVQLEPLQPRASIMRFDGHEAVGLGVIPREGINSLDFGESVRSVVEEHRRQFAPVEIEEVIYQPARVEQRLDDLLRALLLGVVIVALVLFAFMGTRLGFLVAAVVPLVVLSALAVFALFGGTLQQISVAAFVLALGMLVDNAIVMTESIQWRLDQGEDPLTAAAASVRELALPLTTATATTIAVFVPMLLSEGATAEFTRSIPIVLMITLTISCLYALLFTPAVASRILRPRTATATPAGPHPLERWLVERRKTILGLATLALVVSLLASGSVRQEFFPESDRNQFVVELELPEGTHLETTSRVADTVEQALQGREEVSGVLSLVGRSLPHFYYNLAQIPWSPHLAQMVVTTEDVAAVRPAIDWLREWSGTALPEAQLVARPLEQGPPVLAPIELRLFGDDLPTLAEAADQVTHLLHEVPGTADVRSDLGPGGPMIRLRIDDSAAAARGVDRATIATSIYGRTRGIPVGALRRGEDPIPILLRSPAGENLDPTSLASLDVRGAGAEAVPLSEVATSELEWAPAAIQHRDRHRVVRVLSQLTPGTSYSDVLPRVQERLAETTLPAGVRLEFGGAAEGSDEANGAMLRTLPIGLLLLIGILMAEFNSFRRLGIILVTVPLAAAGVIPGLLLAGQPFGFMSFLGLIALVGVVVNNAIVLLDLIETERQAGASIEQAVLEAVRRRTRPILLTSATTVAGLLPLTFSGTTLWPPLAWAMISGLIASTGLSLAVVPALYLTLFPESRGARGPRALVRAALFSLTLLLPTAASAQEPWSVERIIDQVDQRPAIQASRYREAAAVERAQAARIQRFAPNVEVLARAGDQDRDLVLSTPLGPLALGSSDQRTATVALMQPLVDRPSAARAAAASAEAKSQRAAETWTTEGIVLQAIDSFLQLYELDALIRADRQLEQGLDQELQETRARVQRGRDLEVSAGKIELALIEVELRLAATERRRGVVAHDLARQLGLDPTAESFSTLSPLPAPAADTKSRSLGPLDVGPLVAEALEQRADLHQTERQIDAVAARYRELQSTRLPQVSLRLAGQWDSATPFADDQWLEGGVQVQWRPFRAGRAQQAAAVRSDRQALESWREELRAAIALEVAAAEARLADARDQRRIAERALELAIETARVESVRYEAGRITANDWLAAESNLARHRAASTRAHTDEIRAGFELQRTLGRPLEPRAGDLGAAEAGGT